jgi:hypothetical protein
MIQATHWRLFKKENLSRLTLIAPARLRPPFRRPSAKYTLRRPSTVAITTLAPFGSRAVGHVSEFTVIGSHCHGVVPYEGLYLKAHIGSKQRNIVIGTRGQAVWILNL